VNLKWIRQELGDGEASGLGLDVGTMVRIHMDDFFQLDRLGIFSVGVHLQDVTTTKISWNTKHQDAVPLNVKWGVSYQHPLPMGNSSLAVAYNRDSRYRGKNRWGLEYTGFGVLGLRVGLDDGRFTGGIGFRVWILQVDYAFVSHELDALHRISCSVTL
jgi:hypothetical protein